MDVEQDERLHMKPSPITSNKTHTAPELQQGHREIGFLVLDVSSSTVDQIVACIIFVQVGFWTRNISSRHLTNSFRTSMKSSRSDQSMSVSLMGNRTTSLWPQQLHDGALQKVGRDNSLFLRSSSYICF